MSQEPLFLHLENSGPNQKGVMYRKFLAQNLWDEPSGRRPLLHLPTSRLRQNTQVRLSMGSTPLSHLPYQSLAYLTTKFPKPGTTLHFATKPAVTRQATRWRSGVRQVRALSLAGLGDDAWIAEPLDYGQKGKARRKTFLVGGFRVPGTVWALYRDDTRHSSPQP